MRRARGHEGAEVGGRLDEDGLAGRGQRPEDGGQRRLAARADDHVVRAEAAAGRAREPGAQLLATLDRAAVPRARTPRCAAERRPGCCERLQLRIEVARGQGDRARRRQLEQLAEAGAVAAGGAERNRLPGQVGRIVVDGCSLGDERPAAGARDDEALLCQAGDRALHGHRGGAVARHQLPDGRQAAARGEGTGSRPHVLDNTIGCVIVNHE